MSSLAFVYPNNQRCREMIESIRLFLPACPGSIVLEVYEPPDDTTDLNPFLAAAARAMTACATRKIALFAHPDHYERSFDTAFKMVGELPEATTCELSLHYCYADIKRHAARPVQFHKQVSWYNVRKLVEKHVEQSEGQ